MRHLIIALVMLLIANTVSGQNPVIYDSTINNTTWLTLILPPSMLSGGIPCSPDPFQEESYDFWWDLGDGFIPVYDEYLREGKYLNQSSSGSSISANFRHIYSPDDEIEGVVNSTTNYALKTFDFEERVTDPIKDEFGLSSTADLPVFFTMPERLGVEGDTLEIASLKGGFFLGISAKEINAGSNTLSWFGLDFPDILIEQFENNNSNFQWVWDPSSSTIPNPQPSISTSTLTSNSITFTATGDINNADMLFIWFYYDRCENGANTRNLVDFTLNSSSNQIVRVNNTDDPNQKCLTYPLYDLCKIGEYEIRFVNEGRAPVKTVLINDKLPNGVSASDVLDVWVDIPEHDDIRGINDSGISSSTFSKGTRTFKLLRSENANIDCTIGELDLDMDDDDVAGFYKVEDGHLLISLHASGSKQILDGVRSISSLNWPQGRGNVGYIRYTIEFKSEPSRADLQKLYRPAVIEFDCSDEFIITDNCLNVDQADQIIAPFFHPPCDLTRDVGPKGLPGYELKIISDATGDIMTKTLKVGTYLLDSIEQVLRTVDRDIEVVLSNITSGTMRSSVRIELYKIRERTISNLVATRIGNIPRVGTLSREVSIPSTPGDYLLRIVIDDGAGVRTIGDTLLRYK